MAVIYKPATVRDYYETVNRLKALHEEFDAIVDFDKRSAFADEHWADLKAHVEPPALNALILEEFMESHERVTAHIADALSCFWNAALGEAHAKQNTTAYDVIACIAVGIEAVKSRLEQPPERKSNAI